MLDAVYRLLGVGAVALALAACGGVYTQTTSGASLHRSQPLVGDREACTQSCDSAYAACMDVGAARREDMADGMGDVFGASAGCDQQLKECLPRCRDR